MPLTVEDGTGLPGADSYESLVELTAYHASHGNADWAALAEAEQERCARAATEYLDAVYGRRLKGMRTTEDQPLFWPRDSVYDADDYLIDDNIVPAKWKSAHAELALKASVETLIPDLDPGDQGIASESNSVGSISTSVTYSGNKPTAKRYRMVELLVAEFVQAPGTVERA